MKDNWKFIIWDPHDGAPRRDENDVITSDGIMGRLTIMSAYLTAYPKYPDNRRPHDLKPGECIRGVIYSLSGSTGIYDIFRIE